MLAGDNSILKRAVDAKIKSEESEIKERIQLAYHSALTGGKGSYTKKSLEEELKKEFTSDYSVDDTDDNNWILKAKGQSVTIPAGEKEEVLAKDKLIINENGSTDAEKSPYVKYNGDLYRVLYDLAYDEKNGTNYGIEIVSVNPLDTVKLGKDDPIILEESEYEGDPGEIGTAERAKWSYNNAIATLNKKAQSYYTNLAVRARCIGSNPSNPLSESGYYTGNNVYDTDASELKTTDSNSKEDRTQLEKIGAIAYTDTSKSIRYWMASRTASKFMAGMPTFKIKYVDYDSGGGIQSYHIYYYKGDSTVVASGGNCGLRPVIKLKPNLKIERGKGTANEPYELKL